MSPNLTARPVKSRTDWLPTPGGDGRAASDLRAAHRQAGDLQRRLADADRHPLAVLAADADAGVEAEVVADHGDLGQRRGAVADQRRALHRRRHLAVLDQVGLGALEDELAVDDVDLAAAQRR